jgi:hypothetical protein
VNAEFDGTTIPAYSDHWVSNVFDREGFLTILRYELHKYVCMYECMYVCMYEFYTCVFRSLGQQCV